MQYLRLEHGSSRAIGAALMAGAYCMFHPLIGMTQADRCKYCRCADGRTNVTLDAHLSTTNILLNKKGHLDAKFRDGTLQAPRTGPFMNAKKNAVLT